jgi:hypothetical protein
MGGPRGGRRPADNPSLGATGDLGKRQANESKPAGKQLSVHFWRYSLVLLMLEGLHD